MITRGISPRGFKRLALLVQAQASNAPTVTTLKWYTPPGGMGDSLGGVVDFSDGARGYWTAENFSQDSFVVVDPQGQTHKSTDPATYGEGMPVWARYYEEFETYSANAVKGVMTMAEQEEFNAVLGTDFEVFEPTEEDIQAWTTGMNSL